MTRLCRGCLDTLPVDQFAAYASGARTGRLYSRCKDCVRRYHRERYKTRPTTKLARTDDRRAYERDNRSQMRLDALSAYSDGHPHCKCCGENGIWFLVIDHINNDGSKHRKSLCPSDKNKGSGYKTYAWLKRVGYPQGFQVLCFNCNSAKSIHGTCPHQRNLTPEK